MEANRRCGAKRAEVQQKAKAKEGSKDVKGRRRGQREIEAAGGRRGRKKAKKERSSKDANCAKRATIQRLQ